MALHCAPETVAKRELRTSANKQYLLPPSFLSDVQYRMQYTYRMVTLNINGIESHNRIRMLEEFVHRHDVDIALLQEVTDGNKLVCKG